MKRFCSVLGPPIWSARIPAPTGHCRAVVQDDRSLIGAGPAPHKLAVSHIDSIEAPELRGSLVKLLRIIPIFLAAAASSYAFIPSLTPTAGNPYAQRSGAMYGHVVRTTLTADEMQQPMMLGIELNLQNSEELQAHINHGDILTRAQIEPYLPTVENYNAVKTWLLSQGFKVTQESSQRHAVFVTGSVAQCAMAFQTSFGRVATTDGEFSAALIEPTLPNALSACVHNIHGLQPQLIRHHSPIASVKQLLPAASTTLSSWALSLKQINTYYGVPTNYNGSGQTIAIIGDNLFSNSDLTAFWALQQVPQSLNNITTVLVQGGPGTSTKNLTEANLDVQYASSIANGVTVRYYAVPYFLTQATEFAAYEQILNDLPANPSLHVTSESFAGPDQGASSVFQLLAAQGVSTFACSGDWGSNPNWSTGIYDVTQPLTATYPASDPNVTGVGGTSLQLDSTGAILAPPCTWGSIQNGVLVLATGGGQSSANARPSWQAGTGIPTGTGRCVPDVAAVAGSTTYPTNNVNATVTMVMLGGFQEGTGGTSVTCPIWASFAAIINQARANNGQSVLGLLNPRIYPLNGTAAFNAVLSGSNGAYSAGAGYNMCTGLGSPNVGALITALTAQNSYLANLSARAYSQPGANQLIAGFVTAGSSSKQILVRGDGPALSAFGVTGVLTDPKLTLVSGTTAVATTTTWDSTLSPTFTKLGAFALTAGSHDTALLQTVAPGPYTAQVVSATTNSGVALAEVYDADEGAPTNRLINLSARAFVGTGSSTLIGGFVIEGNTPLTVIIRADGPSLSSFGVTGALGATTLTLSDTTGTIATDTGWSNAPITGAAATSAMTIAPLTAAQSASVGAFALSAGSGDSAIVATLPPGAYTAQVAGISNTTGIALIEVYELR